MRILSDETQRDLLGFFGAESRGAAAALFRVGYGLLATWTALQAVVNTSRYWGPDAMVPAAALVGKPWAWLSPLVGWPSAWLAWAHTLGFLAAAVALTVGVVPRMAAVVIYLANLSLQHRNPLTVNGGDRLFLVLAAFAVFLPLGRRLSLAGGGSGWKGTVWAQRMVQLQVVYVYLESAAKKLSEPRWRSGWALRDVLASPVYAEWPSWVGGPLVQVLTWGTLAFEVGFPFLVFSKRWRPWALGAGVLFHVGIHAVMLLPMFSAVMIVSYALFLDEEEAERIIRWLRGGRGRSARGRTRRRRSASAIAATPP
jgi:vitamin K-dependent gamma-carboxylase-like protein